MEHMVITVNSLEAARQNVEATIAAFERLSHAPTAGNSTPEEQRRLGELLLHAHEAVQRARALAEQARAEALAAEQALDSDRTTWPTSRELAAASARARFIKADCETLDLKDLDLRLQQALFSGDRASMWLWARYGRARAEATHEALGQMSDFQRKQAAQGLYYLRQSLEALEEAVIPAKVKAAAARAEALRKKAAEVEMFAKHRLAIAAESAPKSREVLRQHSRAL
jgi:hypothetical protein